MPGLRAIHAAITASDTQIKTDMVAVIDAMKTPQADDTFSPATVQAIDKLRSDVTALRTRISRVQRASGARSHTLAYLAILQTMLADLESLGQTTDPTQIAHLTGTISALGKSAAAAYNSARGALNLPAAKAVKP